MMDPLSITAATIGI
jgi:N-methylhydantoinase B/oxoprolinase/acetone carboxylase alpha subunit